MAITWIKVEQRVAFAKLVAEKYAPARVGVVYAEVRNNAETYVVSFYDLTVKRNKFNRLALDSIITHQSNLRTVDDAKLAPGAAVYYTRPAML